MDECANARYAPARCRTAAEADNRVEASTSMDGLAKTGNLMGPRVYPWGSMKHRIANTINKTRENPFLTNDDIYFILFILK